MTDWNTERVAARFDECVTTLHRLPGERSLGYASYWPEMQYQPHELARQAPPAIRLQATPDQISRMEETLSWISWIGQEERHLVWLRAYRTPWREIARQTGFSRTSAQRYWLAALLKIADRLAQMLAPAG